MRKKESPQITPLMLISIILTTGILIAKMGYAYIDTIYWLVAALLSWGISFYLLKRSASAINIQCLSLIFCIFSIGGTLTSHQMDKKKQEKPQIITEEGLSSFDKTILITQECRNTIQKHLRSLNIQEQDFAIVSAMTLGDKTSLTKETKDIYSISGASHILAVSGLHIGIIFQLFILLLGGRRRSIPTIMLSITAIWAYVIFIGMPASAIRSATMISICCFAMLSHRKALSVNNLAFAYVIMLIYNPLYLFDISFQMSFMAVYSILLFYQPLEGLCSTSHFYTRWPWSMLCISIAAQIGTMPLIIYYFGRISCYALFTGFIAIPAATVILWLSAAILLLTLLTHIPLMSLLSEPLLHFAASGLISITQATNTALKLTTMLPGASIDGIKINIPQLCLIYFCIIVGYIFIRKTRYYSKTSSIPFSVKSSSSAFRPQGL